MDFGFSKSEKLLIESARDFLEKEAEGLARQVEETDIGYSPQIWRKMAELGWMGILIPEKYGGVEGTFLELTLIIEELGSALVPGPFISTIISGYSVLKYGTEAQKNEFLPKLARGELIMSPAFIEPDSDKGEVRIEDEARATGGDYILSGTRLFVPYAHVADWLLYRCRTDKTTTLFLINAKSPGVHCEPLRTIASDMQCEVNLDKVNVPRANTLGIKRQGKRITTEIEEWGAMCHSAFILGLLEKVLKMTVKHAKQREQFGRPIGSFQAIQHQCADMATDIDRLKFLTYQAALRLSQDLPSQKEISMAKALASEASRRVSLLGVKIHGGLGVSEEHDMQLYFRHAKAAEQAFGDADYHREIVATELGL